MMREMVECRHGCINREATSDQWPIRCPECTVEVAPRWWWEMDGKVELVNRRGQIVMVDKSLVVK